MGIANVFIGNHAVVSGPGYGMYVQSQERLVDRYLLVRLKIS